MENVRFEKKGTVGYLTICRPKALNALNFAVLEEIDIVLDAIEKDAELTCVIVTGEGEKAFAAGADIGQMAEMTEAEALEFGRFGNFIFYRLERLQTPTIALVNGYALGGGCELALCCDIIMASTNAVFALPETSLGIICGFGGTQRLAKRVGPGSAKYLMFTGVQVGAEEAMRMRLCDGVAEPENLAKEGLELAARIGRNAKYAVQLAKKAINEGVNYGSEEGFAFENVLFSKCFETGEAQKIMKAFLEHKK